jgi:hypothetical protein
VDNQCLVGSAASFGHSISSHSSGCGGDLVALAKQRWIMEVPEAMQEGAQQFEQWRSSHSGRRPIPDALEECGRSGPAVWSVSHPEGAAIGLQQAQAADDAGERASAAPSSYIRCACIIELEGPRGTMRIEWKGATAMPGEAVIASILWQSVHLSKPAGAAIKLLMFDGQAQKGT